MKTLKYRIKGVCHIANPETGEVTQQELVATVEGEEATEENLRRVRNIAVDGLIDEVENTAVSTSLHRRLAIIEAAWARTMKLLGLN